MYSSYTLPRLSVGGEGALFNGLQSRIGIDLLLVLIDWYEEEGGDVQRKKKISA